jgi:hypothetical protein
MKKDNIEFGVDRSVYGQNVSLYGYLPGKAIKEVIYRPTKEAEQFDPFLKLTIPEAQNLIDALYYSGLRPTGQTVTDKTDIANHLEDMRKIAFKQLEL